MKEAVKTTSNGIARQSMRSALLAVAFVCAAVIIVVQVLSLVAGTWVTRDIDGTERLGLGSLSVLDVSPRSIR